MDPVMIQRFWESTTQGSEPNPSHLPLGKQFASPRKYQCKISNLSFFLSEGERV
jgi:hypothetical protein